MSQNKEIKFQFVVDERSAQQMKRVLTELIGLGQKLAQTLNGVNLGGAGGGGGGLISGSVGGSQSPQQMITGGGQAQRGGAAQNRGLAQIFLDSSKSIKGLADVSKDSMRVMSDAIKRAVDDQKRSISDLDSQLERLAKRYDDLKTRERAAVQGGHMTAAQARQHYDAKRAEVMGEHAETQIKRQKAGKDLGTLHEHERQMAIARDPYSRFGGPDDGGAPPPPGFGSRMGSAFGAMTNPKAMIGRAGARFGPAAAAAASIGIISNTATGMIWDDPMVIQRMRAQHGQLWSQSALATHTGDRSYVDAMNRIMANSDKRKDFQTISDQDLAARVANFKFKDLVNPYQLILKQSPGAIKKTINERQLEYIESEFALDPVRKFNMDMLTGQSSSRLAGMRALGIGNSKNPKTGRYETGFDDYLQSFRDAGYSDGEVIGTFQGIASAGTRKAGYRFSRTALSAQAAGIGNATGIIGAMSEGGLGNAASFMDRLLTTRGDASALNQIGSTVAQMIQHGGYGGSGNPLLDVMSRGLTGNAQDALIARQNTVGMQASEKGLIQGGMDGYQMGMNTYLGFEKFRDKGLYAAQYVSTQMTAEEVAGLRKGELSPQLQALGFTKDDISGLMELQGAKSGSRLDRLISDPRAAGSPMAKTLDGLRAHISEGGSPQSWYQGMKKGKDREKALSEVATGFLVSGQATDYGTAIGMARTEFGIFDEAGPRTGRKGAAGSGSLEADQTKLAAQHMKDFADFMKKEADGLFAQGSRISEARDIMVKNISDIARSGGDFAAAVAAMTEALRAATSGQVKPENASEYMQAVMELDAAKRAAARTSGGGGKNVLDARKRVEAAQRRVNSLKR